jgi:hypothetical protein
VSVDEEIMNNNNKHKHWRLTNTGQTKLFLRFVLMEASYTCKTRKLPRTFLVPTNWAVFALIDPAVTVSASFTHGTIRCTGLTIGELALGATHAVCIFKISTNTVQTVQLVYMLLLHPQHW